MVLYRLGCRIRPSSRTPGTRGGAPARRNWLQSDIERTTSVTVEVTDRKRKVARGRSFHLFGEVPCGQRTEQKNVKYYFKHQRLKTNLITLFGFTLMCKKTVEEPRLV